MSEPKVIERNYVCSDLTSMLNSLQGMDAKENVNIKPSAWALVLGELVGLRAEVKQLKRWKLFSWFMFWVLAGFLAREWWVTR